MEKFHIFMLKLSLDIKKANLWLCKTDTIVLLQEHCEKIQFKSGHPVLVFHKEMSKGHIGR